MHTYIHTFIHACMHAPLPLIRLPRLKLVDIVEQFAVVLHALPFVAPISRDRALNALKDFATKDVPAPPPPIVLRPGSSVFIKNRFFKQCLAHDTLEWGCQRMLR